jgi:hypothetical protein
VSRYTIVRLLGGLPLSKTVVCADERMRFYLFELGFVQEGYFRENDYEPADGRFTDTAMFSQLQADWRDRANAQRGMEMNG